MSTTETYNHLLNELKRLIGKDLTGEEKNAIFQRYIYDRVPDNELFRALKGKMKKLITVTLPEGLELEPILKQTQKILTLMEVSDDWKQFEGLANKGKKPDKELTDFDKILQGILGVPKPREEKDNSNLE